MHSLLVHTKEDVDEGSDQILGFVAPLKNCTCMLKDDFLKIR